MNRRISTVDPPFKNNFSELNKLPTFSANNKSKPSIAPSTVDTANNTLSTHLVPTVDRRIASNTTSVPTVDRRNAFNTTSVPTVDKRNASNTQSVSTVDKRNSSNTQSVSTVDKRNASNTQSASTVNEADSLYTPHVPSVDRRKASNTPRVSTVDAQVDRHRVAEQGRKEGWKSGVDKETISRKVSVQENCDNSSTSTKINQKEESITKTRNSVGSMTAVRQKMSRWRKISKLGTRQDSSVSSVGHRLSRPFNRYENTFILPPSSPTLQYGLREKMSTVVQREMHAFEGTFAKDEILRNKFSQDNRLIRKLSDDIKFSLREIIPSRHRLVVFTFVGDNEDQGISFVSRCLWDSANDVMASANAQLSNVVVSVLAFAVYFE